MAELRTRRSPSANDALFHQISVFFLSLSLANRLDPSHGSTRDSERERENENKQIRNGQVGVKTSDVVVDHYCMFIPPSVCAWCVHRLCRPPGKVKSTATPEIDEKDIKRERVREGETVGGVKDREENEGQRKRERIPYSRHHLSYIHSFSWYRSSVVGGRSCPLRWYRPRAVHKQRFDRRQPPLLSSLSSNRCRTFPPSLA